MVPIYGGWRCGPSLGDAIGLQGRIHVADAGIGRDSQRTADTQLDHDCHLRRALVCGDECVRYETYCRLRVKGRKPLLL